MNSAPRLWFRAILCGAAALATLVTFAADAAARPRYRLGGGTQYTFEAEPHLALGAAPPGPGTGSGWGFGFRGSVLVAPAGFIESLNDSVAIGFGLDWAHYRGRGAYWGECTNFVSGPNGTRICTEVGGVSGGPTNYVLIPVVMQWSFWLTEQWSLFAEPGINIYAGAGASGAAFALYAGARLRLADQIALTFRIGYPTVTVGLSFFL